MTQDAVSRASGTMPGDRFSRHHPEARQVAARGALAICASADAIAREALDVVGQDDDRLFSLLEQRDEMLQDLSEHLVLLRLERPTADSPLYAATERAVDDAEVLLRAGADKVRVEWGVNVNVNVNELRLGFSNTTRNPEGILSHNNRKS
jgi:hypothetical protein